MKTTGIALIILGLVLTIFTAGKFYTKEKVVDLGKIQITSERPHYLTWSPVLGIALMAIGGFVLLKATKK